MDRYLQIWSESLTASLESGFPSSLCDDSTSRNCCRTFKGFRMLRLHVCTCASEIADTVRPMFICFRAKEMRDLSSVVVSSSTETRRAGCRGSKSIDTLDTQLPCIPDVRYHCKLPTPSRSRVSFFWVFSSHEKRVQEVCARKVRKHVRERSLNSRFSASRFEVSAKAPWLSTGNFGDLGKKLNHALPDGIETAMCATRFMKLH